MKPPVYPLPRHTLRLKPGRLLCLPPRFLKHSGWRIGDVLRVTVEGQHATVARLPDERSWRIDRLRQRTGSTARVASPLRKIRTYGDYLALRRSRNERRRESSGASLTLSREP